MVRLSSVPPLLFAALLFLALFASPVRAQSTGVIEGTVVDAETEKTLPGANVTLLNTNYGTATGSAGRFRIEGVTPGTQTIIVDFLGYAQYAEDVSVSAGETLQVNIPLSLEAAQLDEIVVSSQKYEQNLQEVPGAVSALTPRDLENNRIYEPTGLTATIPNLVSTDYNGTGMANSVSIRGISSTAGNALEQAVATYVNGVYQFSQNNFQFVDVERVEVLRGPQGTLYGRGAMGGVINIITREPSNQLSAFAQAEVGNYGFQRHAAGVSTPIVEDKLYMNVGGQFTNLDGYFENRLDDDAQYGQRDAYTGNASLRFLPSDRWSLTLRANGEYNEAQVFPRSPTVEAFEADPRGLTLNNPNALDRAIVTGSLSARYFGEVVDFVSQTAYQYYDSNLGEEGTDFDYTPAPAITLFPNENGPFEGKNNFTQELRLSSAQSQDSPLNWTTGAFFFNEDNTLSYVTRLPVASAELPVPLRLSTVNNNLARGVGIFGQATYALTDRLDVTAGLRYDYQDLESENQTDTQIGEDPVVAETPGPLLETQETSDAFSPKASVSYQFTDDVMGYASYARGYRPGGANVVTNPDLPESYQTYDAETLDNFEIGLKTSFFDNRVRANLTGFYIDWTDQQVGLLDLTTNQTLLLNAGASTSRGLELETSALLLEGLRFDWNFGYTDAEFDELNYSLDPEGAPNDLSGRTLPYAPEVTSMLAGQYSLPLGSPDSPWLRNSRLTLRGEWEHLGTQYFDITNVIEQEGYSLFNAQAQLEAGRLGLKFWMQNITDEEYIGFAVATQGTQQIRLGTPFTYGFALSVEL